MFFNNSSSSVYFFFRLGSYAKQSKIFICITNQVSEEQGFTVDSDTDLFDLPAATEDLSDISVHEEVYFFPSHKIHAYYII